MATTWLGAVQQLGSSALVLLVVYLLTDKWAGKFLEAIQRQAEALAQVGAPVAALATAIAESRDDQKEILIAVKVIAKQVDAYQNYLAAMEGRIQKQTEKCQEWMEAMRRETL
jgi:negative regulator of sigma E activity